MPYIEYPRVEESLVVTGTGAVTTGSTPVSGAQTFVDVATIGDTFPLWIVDTTTSPPTIESSLGTYTAANTITRTGTLVSFLGNACSVFIARIPGGNAAQTLEIADASTGTQAVALAQAQADFAKLAGLATQTFDVADATAAGHAINLGQAQADFAALAGNATQDFVANNLTTALDVDINQDFYLSRNDGTSPYFRITNFSSLRFASNLGQTTIGVDASNRFTANGSPVAAILTVNAPVDRLAAGDVAATTYTNPGPRLWVDYIIQYSSSGGDIDINGVVGVLYVGAGMPATIITPPGGSLSLAILPARWYRVIM